MATSAASAAAADPRGFRGTLSIVHTYAIQDDPGDMVTSSLHDDRFEATYRLSARRWRSRFAPPRSYIITGRGHEELDLHRTDLYQNGPIHERTDLFGFADGQVRIVRRPNAAGELGALLLRLRPRGRFILGLSPLGMGEYGTRLNYELLAEGSQPCYGSPGGGTMGGREVYNQGVYEVTEINRCPDAEPFEGRRLGKPYTPTIWGYDIWNPAEGNNPHPNVCHGSVVSPPFPANTDICGRYRGGSVRRKTVVGRRSGYIIRGNCVFYPRGPLGTRLPEPTDGIWEACLAMDNGALWRVRTVFRLNLTPVG